jgi:NADH-quinone oxidoreductase subunit H
MIALEILLVSIPSVFFLSLLFEGIDRKIHARMQRRIGPPIIQPFYDFIKLLFKENIVPETAARSIFNAAPSLAAASSIVGAAIPLANLIAKDSIIGDLILVMYLLTMSSIMVIIGGSSSGNPYGAVGSSRKIMMLIGYEIPLLVSVVSLSIKAGPSLTHYSIILSQIESGKCFAYAYPSSAIAALTFLLCVSAAVGVVPFDIPEAKTEIIHGPLIEYSGPHLALLKLAKSLTNFSLSLLAFTLFFYFPAISELSIVFGEMAALGICLLGSLAVMFLTVTLPRTVFARLKIGQAFKTYWFFPLPMAIISLILSVLGW